VPHLSDETNLGRLVRVVVRELDLGLEVATFIERVLRPAKSYIPYEDVVILETY
jgi:hypothetical protein